MTEMRIGETRYARTDDGVELAYRLVGDGPVDLLWSFNQLGDVEAIWDFAPIRAFLEELGAISRLIVHDRRGMGRSSRQRADLETEVADLLTLLDDLETERPYLVGALTGGAAYAAFAAAHPDRVAGIVWYGAFAQYLRTPDYPWGRTADELEEYTRQLDDGWGSEAFAERFIGNEPAIAGNADARRFFAHWMRRTGSAQAVAAANRAWGSVDLHPVLRTVRTPSLIISRDGDDPEEAAYVASLIPAATLLRLESENFMPFHDSGPLIAAIREFIAEASPA
jgi:pimeloyl-ACP methyl ester carboxylesterase